MSTKRKIILTVLLGVLVAIGVYCVVYDILLIKERLNELELYITINGKNDGYYQAQSFLWQNYIISYLIFLIPLITFNIYFGIKVINLWTNKLSKNIINIEYSYQEYKEQKRQKRKIKAEKEKQKLLDKLSKM